MPMPTANHAICAANVNGNPSVYVFGGITTGLVNDSIHRKAFRYDVDADTWYLLPDIPDTLGKIASAASVVGDTAYVIGGYHVFDGAPFELSSDRVHRLDLVTGQWMDDGAPVPVPIDDQVQAVWRDSLIYVITGWSNTTNVPNVQVYDPAYDSWSQATPVPNNNQYKAFGASGTIIGDTIYYFGGASSSGNFPAQDKLRIGHIDPAAPLNITWLPAVTSGLGPRYRSACVTVEEEPWWVGGSSVSYNYDAVAYNGSGVVVPATTLLHWSGGMMQNGGQAAPQVMDLRGAGELGDGRFVIVGGIGAEQQVLDSVWLVVPAEVGVPEHRTTTMRIAPNPSTGMIRLTLPDITGPYQWTLLDPFGGECLNGTLPSGGTAIDLSGLVPGMYWLRVASDGRVFNAPLVIAR